MITNTTSRLSIDNFSDAQKDSLVELLKSLGMELQYQSRELDRGFPTVPNDIIACYYYSIDGDGNKLSHTIENYENQNGTKALRNATLLILIQHDDMEAQVSVVSEKWKVYDYNVEEVEFLFVDGLGQDVIDKWLAHRRSRCSTCNIL
jgi:hypothetical protein